jgi:integrase
MRRRSADAKIPTLQLHAFRRFFGLELLQNHVDVFSIQKLLGHEDLQVMRRYLKQSDQDTKQAHLMVGPIDKLFV